MSSVEHEARPFSKHWMFASLAVFVVCEVLIGVVIGNVFVGKFVSMSLKFTMQGLLHVASFFVGGVIIGVISPGIRILEPAVAAFGTVLAMMVLTLFTPYSFLNFSVFKVVVGGGIAFALALAGAKAGERLTGKKV